MNDEIFNGEKKIKSITQEFECDCGKKFELIFRVKEEDLKDE